MFASQCPGWICYAEKSQPQSIPYISSTKSPQQIFGRVVREILHESEGIAHSIPYIVSIQPCFDKKLEASRRVRCHLSIILTEELMNDHHRTFIMKTINTTRLIS